MNTVTKNQGELLVAAAAAKKKPYDGPRLVEYGDFRTLTRGNGGGAGAEGTGGAGPALATVS